ncbi:MAG: hypothetical protein AAB407_00330 [Patescibacteria group bacterium]
MKMSATTRNARDVLVMLHAVVIHPVTDSHRDLFLKELLSVRARIYILSILTPTTFPKKNKKTARERREISILSKKTTAPGV